MVASKSFSSLFSLSWRLFLIIRIISLASPDPGSPIPTHAKQSGIRTLRQVFSGRSRKNLKQIHYIYIQPAGTGEPEVDTAGMDIRDTLEEPCMSTFRPSMPHEGAWAFERGMEAFRVQPGEEGRKSVGVVRIIN